MARVSKAERARSIEQLRVIVKPGDFIYTNLLHVSRSGMYRVIRAFVMCGNAPHNITDLVAAICEGWDDRHHGARASGCGMDMGFHLVYNTSSALWPDGHECTGTRCPSNDHSNGDRNYEPHTHRDGGYALVQKWL